MHDRAATRGFSALENGQANESEDDEQSEDGEGKFFAFGDGEGHSEAGRGGEEEADDADNADERGATTFFGSPRLPLSKVIDWGTVTAALADAGVVIAIEAAVTSVDAFYQATGGRPMHGASSNA